MNKTEWDRIDREQGRDVYRKLYLEFMCNPENTCKCKECPENRNFVGEAPLPCGQWNCWVKCHCKEV